MATKTLIIGGVAGGATAAARLRRRDEKMEIIMFERGDYISYANCGLPYYIGDAIASRDALLVQTVQAMENKFHIDVRVASEVVKIMPDEKKVMVKNLKTGENYEESYDKLVLATGSSPLKPPIPGIQGENIFTLWTVPDTDRIKAHIEERKPKRAAVIGGGFIGLEMAENLHRKGIHVSIIEMQDQVMAPLDKDMANLLHENIIPNGVDLILGDGVKEFHNENRLTKIELTSGRFAEAEMVLLSIGVDHFVTKEKTMIPLAGPANRQARILADNICGDRKAYNGTLGTAVAQVFDLNAASVGLNEKQLNGMGKKKGQDYFTSLINQKSHAGYYPGATPVTLKMLLDKEGKILGGQIVGQDNVDKRIDTLARRTHRRS